MTLDKSTVVDYIWQCSKFYGKKLGYCENYYLALYNNRKPLAYINKEYGIAKPTVKTWIERYNNSGSFDVNNNKT